MRVTVSALDINKRPYTRVYEGELVAVPSWVEYDAIAMTTGESGKFRVRIIDKSNVVNIDGETIEIPVQASKVKEILVKGSKGDTYVVTIEGKRYNCTCSGFQFRRSCRHIMEARSA